MQAFLAINAPRSVLILATDYSQTTVTYLYYELLAEELCGERRDFEGYECLVRAGGSRRGWTAGAGYAGYAGS